MKEVRTLLGDRLGIQTREDGGKTLTGYASVFFNGSPETEFRIFDDFVERIMPGAFQRAIKRDDPAALLNHDPNFVLGRSSAGTLRLKEDKRGLFMEVDLPDTQAGRDVAESVSRGDIRGASFGFKVTDQEFRTEDKTDIREIRGVELFDVSPVTFPAYEGTSVGIRADSAEDAEHAREAYKAALGEAKENFRRKINTTFRLKELVQKTS